MTSLPPPRPGRAAAEEYVARHLAHLACDGVRGSGTFTGGQAAADAALAAFDVTGYASRRNEVFPPSRRGASRLSPYIRHGLLSLPDVWDHVAGGPRRDVEKLRDELLWQEFARHWTAREGLRWNDGESYFFRHLLDGSRAANRLGWQWVTGAGSSKPYGFSRRQVERRAPGICAACDLRSACPIEDWPPDPVLEPIDRLDVVHHDPTPAVTAGPTEVLTHGTPDAIWVTAESLGHRDPALSAHRQVPVLFVFDEPLLASLRLSSKRLVFLTETLAELALEHDLEISLGDPVAILADRELAVTFAPVPGFRRRAEHLHLAEVHPWPWLRRPTAGPIGSFSAWRRSLVR